MNDREDIMHAIDKVVRRHEMGKASCDDVCSLLADIRHYLAHNRSVREVGRKGGARAKEVLGDGGYAKIGRKGGLRTKKLLGVEHYAEIGRRGGTVKKKT